jgi:gluconolactonase
MNGALERITALGERSTVATAAAGEPFLGPNDLVVAGDRVYMTDPGLDLEGSGRIVSIELPSGTAHIVADGLRFPNGITMSAAGDALWVAESTSHRILRFSLSSAGEVGAAEVFYEFADHHPDGIAFDADGNLLVTLCGAGMLHVLDPLADLIDSIPTGGLNCTNCVFGGPAFDTLFLTEDFQEAVLSMQWPVPGQKQYSRSLPHDFELRLAEEEPVS